MKDINQIIYKLQKILPMKPYGALAETGNARRKLFHRSIFRNTQKSQPTNC